MADQGDDSDEGTVEEKPKGGSKKLLIIGLIVGLLLGGGAAFGALIMMKGGEDTHVEEEVVVEEYQIDPQFVKVEHMTIPLIYNNRVFGNATIDFSMKVDGVDNKMLVVQNLPEIRDAMLRHFSTHPIGKKDSPKSIDYILLTDTLLKISNDVLHSPLVLQAMVVQVRLY